ncbi:MAG: Rieske 2Fe-2S domain-containing protein [Novosphingobium sp.]
MAEFLRNCWYMAGWSYEIGEAPLRRRLLGDPMVFYRLADGSVGALVDRCPHRFAPLSMGTRDGDCLVCPYHGLTFDAAGTCVRNPYADDVPKGASVRAFATQERDGIVWFWAGDAEQADGALIPDFAMLELPGHGAPLCGSTIMAAPYEMGIDNLMDLSHIEWVHKGSFAGNGVIFAGSHSLKQDGAFLHSNWWMPDVAAPPHTYGIYDPAMRCDHWLDMRWQAPAAMYLQVGACPHDAPREGGVVAHQAHILTPESRDSTHYFWATTRSFPPSEEGDGMLRALFSQAFDLEDKPIIEATFNNMDGRDFWDMKPAYLGIDAGGTTARRILQKMIAAEVEG